MSATDFGDPDQIIYIPARELTGTREAKLADLDLFLAQLQVVRLALCGQPVQLEGFDAAFSEPRLHDRRGAWTWPLRWLRTVLNARRTNAKRAKGGRG
jgi:hypothetical protein